MDTINFGSKKNHNLRHINYDFDSTDGIMWVYLDAYPRPCVTPELVDDIRTLHRTIEINNGSFPINGNLEPVHFHILDSNSEGVFNLGGDLAYFLNCLKNNDKEALREYAVNCINAIYPIMVNFKLPIVTISLVRGNALGGGFEIALSSDVIIAEKSAELGFPEILFNCFPGMGAFQSLSSRVGITKANQMISSGKLYKATELHDLGIVDFLVEDNCGKESVYNFINNHKKHSNGYLAIQHVTQRLKQFNYEEIMDICSELWVETVFNMSDKDKRTISRLLRSQQRYIQADEQLVSNNAFK